MPDPSFQCRHIHTAGHRCASPALRHETFCYFHHTSRKPIPQAELQLRRGKQATFDIPSLEDRPSIQLCLRDILHRLANHDLDPTPLLIPETSALIPHIRVRTPPEAPPTVHPWHRTTASKPAAHPW